MITILILAAAQAVPGAILIDRNRIDRAPAPAAPALNPAPSAPPPVIAASDPGVPITGVRFVGAKAPAPVADAAKAFLGKPATRATLTALATAMSEAYGKSDVALYTVAVPAQDFSRGIVTIRLTEGRIGGVAMKGDEPSSHPQLLGRLAPLTEETPLTRATFERALVLARGVPGLTIEKTDFTEPRGDGTLLLAVTPKQKRTRVTAGFSNRGVELLGDGQFDARAELYGAATDGDVAWITGSAATDFERFRYIGAGYSAPIGTSGLTASASGAYLETKPRRIPVEGRAKQVNLSLSYPLIRDFHRSADVSVALDGLNSDNATLGNVVSSERSRALRAAASIAVNRARRSFSVSASVSQGVDILGARVVAPVSETGFLKATAAATVAQAIGKRASVRLSASGQYSRDRLPAAELFAIGGEALGRGFDTAILTGDRGGGALAELAWRPLKTGNFASSEVYGFGDYAGVRLNRRGATFAPASYDIASAGVRFRARYKARGEFGLEAARTLDDPYPSYRGGDWRLSVMWRVTA